MAPGSPAGALGLVHIVLQALSLIRLGCGCVLLAKDESYSAAATESLFHCLYRGSDAFNFIQFYFIL